MAFDTRQKRASVIGVGRAWYRNSHPSGLNAAQRAGIGQVYSGLTFAATPPIWALESTPADGFSKDASASGAWNLQIPPADGWNEV